jgi:hypothetical protein
MLVALVLQKVLKKCKPMCHGRFLGWYNYVIDDSLKCMNLLVHEDISHVIDGPRNLFSVCRQRCCEINLGGATWALETLPDRVTSNSHHLEKRLLLLMLAAVLTIHFFHRSFASCTWKVYHCHCPRNLNRFRAPRENAYIPRA